MERRLNLVSMIPIIVFMLLSTAIYSTCVKMRNRLEDDEKRANHPLELSDKAASIWNELSETSSTSPKKPVKEVTETQNEGQGKDGKPNEDKQPTEKGNNAASKKSNLNSK